MQEKIFLNSIEEITSALQNGETIFEDEKDRPKLYMKNGFIISEYEEGGTFINAGSLHFLEDYYYCYKKELLKLRTGNLYKTRDGRKVVCYYADMPNCGTDTFYMMEIGKCINPKRYSVYATGMMFSSKETTDDIVDYWEE